MNWKVRALYLYRENEHYTVSQIYKEMNKAVGVDKLVIDKHNDKYWLLNNKLHREDGPAIERTNGSKEWWLNGKLHREDGPAIESVSGTKYWLLNGKLHRENGPAVEYVSGSKEWWLNGVKLAEEEFNKRTK